MIEYLDELKQLLLPEGSYAIFGSGPLAVRGIRRNRDLDVLVTPDLWKELAEAHPVTRSVGRPDTIYIDHLQILEVRYAEWHPPIHDPLVLITEAETIQGLPFVRLEHLLACKRRMAGAKHARDVEMIREHLGSREGRGSGRAP